MDLGFGLGYWVTFFKDLSILIDVDDLDCIINELLSIHFYLIIIYYKCIYRFTANQTKTKDRSAFDADGPAGKMDRCKRLFYSI